jgi:hypothetical protein
MSEEQATCLCSLSAQDLRIGNWVYDGERTRFPMQVVGIGKDWVYLDFPGNEGDLWEADIKDLRPIAIDKEVLKKAAFCYLFPYYHKDWGRNTVEYSCIRNTLRVLEYSTSIFQCECFYLHQLQNAYYLATGEEMEVQP